MSKTLAPRPESTTAADLAPVAVQGGMTAAAFKANLQNVMAIRQAVIDVLEEGSDYGTVPGVTRPFLWQPGASKIFIGLQSYADYELERIETPPVNAYRVRARCKIYLKGTGELVGTGPWRGCSSEEKAFQSRIQRRGLIEELLAELTKLADQSAGVGPEAAAKKMAAWIAEINRRSAYGQKYASLKRPLIYPLMKQPTLAACIEMATAAYESAETPGAVQESIDTRAQKRAYVHAARNFAGVEDAFAQDEELVAEEKGKTDGKQAGGEQVVTAGAATDGAAEAATPAKAEKAPRGRARPPAMAGAAAAPGAADPGPTLDQIKAITDLCGRLGVEINAGIQLVGARSPLSRTAAATVIGRLQGRVNQKVVATQVAANRGAGR